MSESEVIFQLTEADANEERYYHAEVDRGIIQTGNKPNYSCEINLTKNHIINRFIIPHRNNEKLICSGNIYEASELTGLKFYYTPNKIEFEKKPRRFEVIDLLHNNAKDVTRELLDSAEIILKEQKKITPTTEALIWLERAANRFRSMALVLKRRRKDKQLFIINDEYDFQDLVHCLITVQFNDIRTEEWTPEYAGGRSKIDFVLPEVSITVETKMAYENHGAKEIGEELIIDSAKYRKYPKCDVLVCLVYDPNFFIKNKFGWINDLEDNSNLKVRVFVIQ